jgi:hypothetical protein
MAFSFHLFLRGGALSRRILRSICKKSYDKTDQKTSPSAQKSRKGAPALPQSAFFAVSQPK